MKAYHAVMGALLYLGGPYATVAVASSEGSAIANVMLKHLNLIDGNVENTGRSPECIALRGKIALHRQSVKTSPDWLGVVRTPQYDALTQARASFKQASCKSDAGRDRCRALRSRLQEDADKLAKTDAWDAFVRGQNFHSLRQGYAKAEQRACVSAPTPHLEVDSSP